MGQEGEFTCPLYHAPPQPRPAWSRSGPRPSTRNTSHNPRSRSRTSSGSTSSCPGGAGPRPSGQPTHPALWPSCVADPPLHVPICWAYSTLPSSL